MGQHERAAAERIGVERCARHSVTERKERLDAVAEGFLEMLALRLKMLRREEHALFPDDAVHLSRGEGEAHDGVCRKRWCGVRGRLAARCHFP